MVALSYKIPLPASPPPSPPRGTSRDPNTFSTSKATAMALKQAIAPHSPIPSPDVSREDIDDASSGDGGSTSVESRVQCPKLNDFELIRVLGKGCAGRVLLVKHTPTSRVHAMKAISKRAVLANDELDHTLAEQHILKHFALSERRNAFISRLYYSFCDKENFYLVMEFYPGGDLATQMEIHGILGPLRTRFYTCDIVAGLEALHKEGILVRDLKPENILLNWHGHAVLADFGLSKSFGFRGDPVPVKLPADYIEGKGIPPVHAGKGFGSYRNGELTWDRAYSFVGTQEYLAPEVIKRNHYTYAIDWWALGCIVCECLTGRVPFRGQEDESNHELYERVINKRWDSMYRGDNQPRSYLKERYRIDAVTYDFIEGLLAKEPMFRLTEPSVKAHGYFTNVDWDTVDKGDYQDPFQLEIDPVAEYNTQFFPRLCLEETPTVDMTGHDYGKDGDEQNALNNDDIFAAAQAKFSTELESFEWTCHQTLDDPDYDGAPIETEADELREEEPTVNQGDAVEEEHVEELSDAASQRSRKSIIEDMPADPDTSLVMPVSRETDDESDGALSSIVSTPSKAPSIVLPLASTPITTSSEAPLHSTPIPSVHVIDSDKLPSPPVHALPLSAEEASPSGVTNRLPSGPPLSGLSVSDVISVPSPVQGSPNLIIRRHRNMPSLDRFNHARLSVEFNGTLAQLGDEDWEQLDAEALPEAPNGANASGQTSIFARGLGSVLGRRPSGRPMGRTTSTSVRVSSGLRKAVTSESDTSSERSPTKTRHPLFASRGIENTKRAFTRIKAFPPNKRTGDDGARSSPSAPTSTVTSPVPSIRGEAPPSDANGRQTLSMRDAPRPNETSTKRNSLVSALSAGPRTTGRSGGELPSIFTRQKTRRRSQAPQSRSSATSGSATTLEEPTSAISEGSSQVPRVELTTTAPIEWELALRESTSN